MQELSQTQVIKPPSSTPWFLSLGLLMLTLVGSLGLWAYGFIQTGTVNRLSSEIATLDGDIAKASLDKRVVIANILKNAQLRPSIDLKTLVEAFREVAQSKGVELRGFAVQNDTISTSLIAPTRSTGEDAVKTIIDMMREKTAGSNLVLNPVYTVAGTPEERKTNVTFKILSSNSLSNVTK